MRVIKIFNYALAGIIFATAFGHYVYNAVTDYGLRTNKLHGMVAAQSDETSDNTSGSGTCDGEIIICDSKMDHELVTLKGVSDSKGRLVILGLDFGTYEKNTSYEVSATHYHCIKSSEKNKCDSRKQRYEKIKLVDGDSSSGDSTSGDITSNHK